MISIMYWCLAWKQWWFYSVFCFVKSCGCWNGNQDAKRVAIQGSTLLTLEPRRQLHLSNCATQWHANGLTHHLGSPKRKDVPLMCFQNKSMISHIGEGKKLFYVYIKVAFFTWKRVNPTSVAFSWLIRTSKTCVSKLK